MVFYVGGGNFIKGRYNIFTGTFIELCKKVMGDQFRIITGVYHPWSFFNVVWALTYGQKSFRHPEKRPYMRRAIQQIELATRNPQPATVIVASSYGTVVAAQIGCYLASIIEHLSSNIYHRTSNIEHSTFNIQHFSLVLGTAMVNKDSELLLALKEYEKKGIIKKLIYEELQDEDDNAQGVASITRRGAYLNSLSIVFPWLTKKYNRPSFLNQHPEKGHTHQRRVQTKQKAYDFINIAFVRHALAGRDFAQRIAQEIG